MSLRRIIFAAIIALAAATSAWAQSPQFGAGQVFGNSTAAQRPGRPETVTAILDRALGSTRGAIIERGASGWAMVGPSATAGLAWISNGAGADSAYGVVSLAGGGCNAALVASNGGILYSTASACSILAGTATARLPLVSGVSSAPSWGPYSLPASVTSGGIPYFSSTSAESSSALLVANQIMLGGGAGAAPATLGSLGTTTTLLHGNAGGAPSFGAVVSGDMNITPTSCTNQYISAISTGGVGTCTTDILASAQHANQGTTTTVLHGNAAGNPSFAAVNLGTEVTGTTAIGNGGTGQITQQLALNALMPTPIRAGDIAYYNGTNWVSLAGNNSGTQVLQENASGVPVWATLSGTGTVTSVTCGAGLSGGTFTTTGTCAINAIIAPQGRLTLTSVTPVMATSVAGATTVYYTPYAGNVVPIYDGTNMVPTAFAEVSQTTTDTTKSPAAVAASKIYDVFCWVDSGTNRCTRGPAWTNATTRGYTLTMTNGIQLNTSAITNGPAALRGTWVGTIASNASSTIDYIFGSSGSGGVAGVLNVWNAYNRVDVGTSVIDNGVTYTYTSITIRQARASAANQVSFVVGAQEDSAFATYTTKATTTAAGAFVQTGIGMDTITAYSNVPDIVTTYASITATPKSSYIFNPAIGTHTVAALEQSDNTNANTFNVTTIGTLSFKLRM